MGGDFYDFFFITDNMLALVMADVSGKGIPASLFMMKSKTAIRHHAALGGSPAEILTKANGDLFEGNDAEMFVTAWIGIIDLETGVMNCANAGHEYPLIMRAGNEYEILKDKHSLPLAAMEVLKAKEYEIDLKPGDKIFVYTDGIPEASDGDYNMFGTDGMLEALNKNSQDDAKGLLEHVKDDIDNFVQDSPQFDDITMLCFRYL